MKKLSKTSIFRPFLEKNNGVLDTKVMNDFLHMMWESIDDPNIYKKIRTEIASLSDTVANNNTLICQDSLYFKKIEAFIELGKIQDIEYLENNFEQIQSSFLAIDGRNINNLTKGQKIENAYLLLDFCPLFRDKINKKNRPSNMHRDLKNLFFASDAKFYVTEDEATYKKSKFIVKALGLKVKVIGMDELRLKFT